MSQAERCNIYSALRNTVELDSVYSAVYRQLHDYCTNTALILQDKLLILQIEATYIVLLGIQWSESRCIQQYNAHQDGENRCNDQDEGSRIVSC